RGLLDAQDDMILRRDGAGNLTFANRAFMEMFGVTPQSVLHKPFQLRVREGKSTPPLSTIDDVRHQRFTQLVETAIGPRWIEWEEQLVPAADGSNFEVQSIGRDVTEQRQSQAQLSEARDQAEAANRAKSRFLAAMSHEIRTPMNGILGMASLLLETQQTPEQQTYTHAIDQSVRTQIALVDEILDFSKIEAGKIELNEAPFVLETCVKGAVELLAPSAHEKGLEMVWSVDPQLPRLVRGDEVRIRQILINLVSNAVKFTDAGRVCVAVAGVDTASAQSPNDFRIEIAVEDTGIGLSQEDMKGLFTEFEQADAAIRRREVGTGLGLAISKQLARVMGGDIHVVSVPGKGSTFTVDLTLGQVMPIAGEEEGYSMQAASLMRLLRLYKPAPAARDQYGSESYNPASNSPEGLDAARRRVLLDEDNEINSLLVKKVLEKCGCDYVAVSNGAEAVAAVRATLEGEDLPFDLVLMDIFMPQVDGIEAARAIKAMYADRREEEGRAPPIVALTANAFVEDRKRYLEAGMDDYLAKPFDMTSLQAVLRRWFAQTAGGAAA
ncbi:MAG: ATP-binding protein, partial [Hyphomicrobium sp.]